MIFVVGSVECEYRFLSELLVEVSMENSKS